MEHLHLHKVRLDAGGRRIGGDYHAPRPNAFTLVGGLIIQDSQQVRAAMLAAWPSCTAAQHRMAALMRPRVRSTSTT